MITIFCISSALLSSFITWAIMKHRHYLNLLKDIANNIGIELHHDNYTVGGHERISIWSKRIQYELLIDTYKKGRDLPKSYFIYIVQYLISVGIRGAENKTIKTYGLVERGNTFPKQLKSKLF